MNLVEISRSKISREHEKVSREELGVKDFKTTLALEGGDEASVCRGSYSAALYVRMLRLI